MKHHSPLHRPAWLASLLVLLAALLPLRADLHLDQLKVGLNTYQDVTITTTTATDVYFEHSEGFSNVKVSQLTPEVQAMLGYKVEQPRTSAKEALRLENLPLDPKYAQKRDAMVTQVQTQLETLNKNIVFAAIGASIFLYLFFCYCLRLICVKANTKPGFMIWLPIFQAFPLLRAARMSAAWFLAWMLPGITPFLLVPLAPHVAPENLWAILLAPNLLSLLATVIWCIKICQARGVSAVFGVMLLLPLLNVIAFFYLAFGPSAAERGVHGLSDPEYNRDRSQDTAFFYQT